MPAGTVQVAVLRPFVQSAANAAPLVMKATGTIARKNVRNIEVLPFGLMFKEVQVENTHPPIGSTITTNFNKDGLAKPF